MNVDINLTFFIGFLFGMLLGFVLGGITFCILIYFPDMRRVFSSFKFIYDNIYRLRQERRQNHEEDEQVV